MQFTKIIGSLFLALLFVSTASMSQSTMMSYNIKYDNKSDTINNWNLRKEKLVKLIAYYEPSVIGMQEVLYNQLNYINDHLENYAYVGVGRVDGKTKGEFSPLFYDTNKYKVLKSSTFWLSETPDEISVGWDASMERICTYALFLDLSTSEKIWVFNTHFDHRGKKARVFSAKLILEKIRAINTSEYPVVFMGDLNVRPDEQAIALLKTELDDGLEISKKPLYGPPGTFNGFRNGPMLHKIDYIFTKQLEVISYRHIDERLISNKHISDHLPVIVELNSSHAK
jgi:endonuclease/exonuclease/phosphatase family metal-dependent hydrolase